MKNLDLNRDEHQALPLQSAEISRRTFLKAPMTLAGASLALSPLLGLMAGEASAAIGEAAVPSPRYYPLPDFVPEFDIGGKLAVVTGASRGIGKAIGDALAALGVEVIGTSRDVANVPNPPAYSLLDLDITDPNSIKHFVRNLSKATQGRKIDIVINSAGRFVMGPVIPPSLKDLDFYLEQLELATKTLYLGHVHMTHALLPLMPTVGYARLLYTVSSAAYLTTGTDNLSPWTQPYISAKRALLAYANSVRAALQEAGSNIVVTTVNPYTIGTTGAEHPNPIYLQPVSNSGFSADSDPDFDNFIALVRFATANGLPPAFVGEAYAQLLRSSSPPPNIIVTSVDEPYATQAGNDFIESLLTAENNASAIPFVCNP